MRATAAFVIVALVACTPAMYKRDVQAQIEGPTEIKVGESVVLLATLEYSDGAVWATQPSVNEHVEWVSSNPAVAAVIATSTGRERNAGRVTGLEPGDTLITATPTSSTTGTGRRIPGALRVTVVR